MTEKTGKVGPYIGVGQKYTGSDGKGRPDHPAGTFNEEQDEQNAEYYISTGQGVDIGVTRHHVFIVYKKMADRGQGKEKEDPIGPAKFLPPFSLCERKKEEDQYQSKKEVDGPV
jgi:hypothetical protein